MDHLAAGVLKGDVRAISRAITLVENRSHRAPDIIKSIYRHTGQARILGLTGSPGVGKSTLASRLIGAYRSSGKSVAVVAVDPTSPFTGGAILGDRVRMSEHYTDEGVFIRSMATRGKLGGLAQATADVADILDAAGYNIILIETVGVGQDEVDVVQIAETCVVILVPGMGDEMQTFKAGIMEIADVFVVNKADTPGADRLIRELKAMLSMTPLVAATQIVPTVASTGEGVEALADCLAALPGPADADKTLRRKSDLALKRLLDILQEELLSLVASGSRRLDEFVEGISKRTIDPFTAADLILQGVKDTLRSTHGDHP